MNNSNPIKVRIASRHFLVNDTIQTFMAEEGDQATFYFCEDHQRRLLTEIARYGVECGPMSKGQAYARDLQDGVLKCSHVLFSLAGNAMGSEALAEFKCPMCAFQKFDFLGEVVKIVRAGK